jgi:hypothetical protein
LCEISKGASIDAQEGSVVSKGVVGTGGKTDPSISVFVVYVAVRDADLADNLCVVVRGTGCYAL